MRAYLLVFLLVFNTNLVAATYEVTFNGIWNASQVAPGTYPGSAHFSTIVGATHTQSSAFWQPGGVASQGVEDVAELGFTDALLSELAAANQAGTAGDSFTLNSQFNLPNSGTTRIEVDNDKAFLTLITMIAPSPDWFAGVSELALQENGQWLTNISADMHPYDAGTEEGTNFNLSNSPTANGKISRLSGQDSPFIGSPVIATLELRLIEPLPIPPTTPNPNSQKSASISSIIGLLLEK